MEELPGNAVAAANPTIIPNETFLLILRWLHRFDLDGVQITTRRLRSLVENNEMPLRFLESVTYIGDAGAEGTKNVLILEPKGQQKERCPLGRHRHGTSLLDIHPHPHFRRLRPRRRLPNPQLLTAHEWRIDCLSFERCNFDVGGRKALEETLLVCRFPELFNESSKLPGGQLNDDILHKIGHAGCALVDFADNAPLTDDEAYAVTDDGVLDYCFSSDHGALKDRGRALYVTDASITPRLAKKCIQASVESKVTGRVQMAITNLKIEHVLIADVLLLELDENLVGKSGQHLEYDFPDQGNGARLQLRIARAGNGCWVLQMRRGNKDDKPFFDTPWEDA